MAVEVKRTKCMKFTRVVGYLRPVENFNPGKKAEFYNREFFKAGTNKSNKLFIEKYLEKEAEQVNVQEVCVPTV